MPAFNFTFFLLRIIAPGKNMVYDFVYTKSFQELVYCEKLAAYTVIGFWSDKEPETDIACTIISITIH